MEFGIHVRTDWNDLFSDHRKMRVKTLCQSKSTPRRCGIPGITLVSYRKDWCIDCVSRLAVQLTAWHSCTEKADVWNELKYGYSVIAAECLRVDIPESIKSDLMSALPDHARDYLPLWHRNNRSMNNPIFVIWSVLMDRCYSPAHPDYARWGGQGYTVHERWLEFDCFVDDIPSTEVTGVYPRAGMGKVIGPDTCAWTMPGVSPRGH